MSDGLSESAIVREVAKEAAQRVARQTIKALQGLKDTLSSEDSGLKTTWDEICVQVQGERSHDWDAYDETARTLVGQSLSTLSKHEREAIWIQTDAGFEWIGQSDNEREAYPVDDQDIIEYLVRECIYAEAGRWQDFLKLKGIYCFSDIFPF